MGTTVLLVVKKSTKELTFSSLGLIRKAKPTTPYHRECLKKWEVKTAGDLILVLSHCLGALLTAVFGDRDGFLEKLSCLT